MRTRFESRANVFVMALFQPVDIASIVVFRLAFGAILLWEVTRYFSNDWIKSYFIDPAFHFSYLGFEWVKPLPGNWMYVYFAVLGILVVFIAVGFCYRASITLFFLAFTYLFLMEEARWLNHFYLVILLSFLLMIIPAHRAFSVDAWLRPKVRRDRVPAWMLWMLRTQIGLVYVFGAVAKLNPDWLHGQPMGIWLAASTDFPIIGSLFTQSWIGPLFSYGGLALDMLFVPCVLWRRTRPFALMAALLFHLINSRLFNIGVFPWMMIAANMLYLSPDWPRRLIGRFRSTPPPGVPLQSADQSRRGLLIAGLCLYLGAQFLIPFRHFLYPGDVNWTQQGDRFAWRMKLLDIQGEARFFVTDPASQSTVEVAPSDYLADWQIHEMIQRPDMTLQFCHYLADLFRQQGYSRVEVRARVMVSVNGHPPALQIDPDVDLAAQPRTLGVASWIVPAGPDH